MPSEVSNLYSGFIIIRLAERYGIEEYDEYKDLHTLAISQPELKKLAFVLEPYQAEGIPRIVSDVEPRQVRELEQRASESDFPPRYGVWQLNHEDTVSNPIWAEIHPQLQELAKKELAYPLITSPGSTSSRDHHQLPGWRVVINHSDTTEIVGILANLREQGLVTEITHNHSLNTYWRVDLRDKSKEEQNILVEQLNALDGTVDRAYLEQALIDPGVTWQDEPCAIGNDGQNYLQLAPQGIDAVYGWDWCTQRNVLEGQGVQFADIEQSWNLQHTDIVAKVPIQPDIGQNAYTTTCGNASDHGTAVLGIVAAQDNGFGVIGIAPHVDIVRVVSHCPNGVVNAIIWATNNLPNKGDVLLLEVQTASNEPIEADTLTWSAIQTAVGNDIIIIEPAGNELNNRGGISIDTRLAGDSGAIMVGACQPSVHSGGHRRAKISNYGSRVHCYAWGARVTSCGEYPNLTRGSNANQLCTQEFNGTSAASAIIAGAAVLLQSIYKHQNPISFLSPQEMRCRLSSAVTGTPQTGDTTKPIGVMPDLRKIINNLAIPC